ncbi:HAD family phosphatase [Vibrio sp. SS-MA-C1-2]|uniref:HAD family hydrolase n=1 Tax=Vibrio sp. SS-MA-C1-2 TaxID=2908646 RepID=UPI001F19E031|nr:HAD family phosphatase [Vibrio sp. SS-MA-C1-2]UJF18080.1 HAD family phosphatase [Vibrio sp. SS-MA-C1-2]
MLNNCDAVLFDMDGTLIDSKPVIELAWTTVATRYGLNISSDQLEQHVHGRNGQYTLSYFFGKFTQAEQRKVKKEVDLIEENSPVTLIPGVKHTLDFLKRHDVKVGLVTASWPERINFIFDYHNLHGYFECVISREDVKKGKPDPEGFQLCSKRLKVPIEKCIIFEDSFSGLEAGIRSGARCIGINTIKIPTSKKLIANYDDYISFNTEYLFIEC